MLVDHRERGSGIPDALAAAGLDVQMADLPVGDYVLGAQLAVERKGPGDLGASIRDGRLFDQATRLQSAFPQAVLLVEGEPRFIAEDAWRGAVCRLVEDGFTAPEELRRHPGIGPVLAARLTDALRSPYAAHTDRDPEPPRQARGTRPSRRWVLTAAAGTVDLESYERRAIALRALRGAPAGTQLIDGLTGEVPGLASVRCGRLFVAGGAWLMGVGRAGVCRRCSCSTLAGSAGSVDAVSQCGGSSVDIEYQPCSRPQAQRRASSRSRRVWARSLDSCSRSLSTSRGGPSGESVAGGGTGSSYGSRSTATGW
ncbi:ERCC4 domain-containing protein [Nocardioides ferulae]|uniref:ERCC4 domain-containing protein n=1 Tax=Nocardioides ferulae TaxID=2340821 RepID=UPI003B84A94F